MSRVQREEIERLKPFLLTLETGTIANVYDEVLQMRMISFPAAFAPVPADDVDLVLLAAATALLFEGPEEAAEALARVELERHPGRLDLEELAQQETGSSEGLWQRVERYVKSTGYGSDPLTGSFRAVGDIYLGRAHRGITHPIVGVACVAYFGAAQTYPPAASAALRCHALWSEWLHRQRPVEQIEQDARNLATEWLRTGATR